LDGDSETSEIRLFLIDSAQDYSNTITFLRKFIDWKWRSRRKTLYVI